MKQKGYSLVEVVGVMALMALLIALAVWAFGGTRERDIREKVSLDLIRIDSAKASWRADNPQSSFPSDESGRFTALYRYMQVGLQPLSSLAELPPKTTVEEGVISYFIGAEGSAASATKGSKSFNRSTKEWE